LQQVSDTDQHQSYARIDLPHPEHSDFIPTKSPTMLLQISQSRPGQPTIPHTPIINTQSLSNSTAMNIVQHPRDLKTAPTVQPVLGRYSLKSQSLVFQGRTSQPHTSGKLSQNTTPRGKSAVMQVYKMIDSIASFSRRTNSTLKSDHTQKSDSTQKSPERNSTSLSMSDPLGFASQASELTSPVPVAGWAESSPTINYQSNQYQSNQKPQLQGVN
jgi:hypothetical protein